MSLSVNLVLFVTLSCGALFGIAAQDLPNSSVPPKRVISLAPNLTEILFALGLGKFMVGVTRSCNYPEDALRLPKVGDYSRPSIEKLVELKPDLVLALNEGGDSVTASLERAHLPFVVLEGKKLEDFFEITRRLGKIFSVASESEKLIQDWKHNWNEVAKSKSSNSILIQLDGNPLIVAGRGTFLSEVMERCGFHNVMESSGYPRISKEHLFKRKIDLILFLGNETQNLMKSGVVAEIEAYWQSSPLTKDSVIHYTHSDELSRLGPRLPKAVKILCSQIKKKLQISTRSSSRGL